jgi:hypothetical protein
MRCACRYAALALTLLCIAGLLHAQYSLQLLQKFPENSAGKNNQAKFADVNGDGKKDLIASYSAPGTTGQVIGIWFNHGNKFSDSVDVTINLTFRNKQCWFNVGDVNGDSIADIVAMSHYSSDHPPKIVFGRKVWPKNVTTADVSCQYPVDADWSSGPQYTSIVIGDFDADGYNDIIFPEQGTKISLGDYGGRMIMYKGGPTVSPVPSMVFSNPGNSRGYAMAPPPDTSKVFLRWFSPFIAKGDFNGDGIEDIFTSGYYSYCNFKIFSVTANKMVGADNTGAGVIFLGGADLDTIPDVIMVPPNDFVQYSSLTDWMYCGYWVFNAGDINGDKADELSLPSWYWGISFVYKGIPGLQQAPSEYQTLVLRDPYFYYTKNRYNSLGYSDQSGVNLLPVGDVNGDGVPDLGNARNFYGLGPDDPGIRLFFGKKTAAGAVDPDFVSSDYTQVQESNMDFDGDGRADLVMTDVDNHLCLVKLVKVTSVEDDWRSSAPKDYVLAQNYPNPFNPSTKISFYLPHRAFVNLTVYNSLGQAIRTLVNEEMEGGAQETSFDAANLSSGNYFYRLTAGGVSQTKLMAVVK